jgi:acetyl esterase/lipase
MLSIIERGAAGALRDRAATGITDPTLTVFRASEPDGSALLIIPGGGYERVVMDKEGYESARWFAERGTTAFVLLYRLPSEGWLDGADVVLQDTQRAMRVIRSSAKAYGIDKNRVGVMGFSAGGHAAAMLATRFDRRVRSPVDAVDEEPTRPDFAVLMYPVIFMQGEEAHAGSRKNLLGSEPPPDKVELHSPQLQVTSGTPPTFLLHAADDEAVSPANSMAMHSALVNAGVPTELHVFTEGGHGFGIRGTAGLPVATWPRLVHAWMQENFEQVAAKDGKETGNIK